MSVTHLTLRHTAELRAVIDDEVDNAVRDLVKAWVRAWNALAADWEAAIADILDMTGDRWPNQRQILGIERVRVALEHATAELEQLSHYTGVRVTTASSEIVAATSFWQSRIIASQLPANAGGLGAQMLASRLPGTVLDAIVARTATQIESRRIPLSTSAVTTMRRELIRGIALGTNPRATAQRMLSRTESGFNGGLSRALNIARTETLDAQRLAAAQYQLQHRDTLKGWVWTCKLDSRSCPSCWARHGTVHPLTEPGPHDHQQGRCARTPVTKSWAELGIAMPEPPSVLPDAESRFRALPRAQQLEIMGVARLEALENGTITWSQLAVNRPNPGWRDSWVPISVRTTRHHAARSA
jgi:hypothetical protein